MNNLRLVKGESMMNSTIEENSERIIKELVQNHNVYQLMSAIMMGEIVSLGFKHATSLLFPTLYLGIGHFDVTEVTKGDVEIFEDHLWIDLWFPSEILSLDDLDDELIHSMPVRTKNGRSQYQVTVVIQEIAYVTTSKNRYYW